MATIQISLFWHTLVNIGVTDIYFKTFKKIIVAHANGGPGSPLASYKYDQFIFCLFSSTTTTCQLIG